jgi:hypothetical protein
LDFTETRLVGHTVMEKLEEWKEKLKEKGLELSVRGLDKHQALSEAKTPTHIKPKGL